MGYSLSIGEAEQVDESSDQYISGFMKIEVIHIEHPGAPAYGEPTDYSNARWPSYNAWYNFCNFTGLQDLFFDEDGNMRGGHPGFVPITEKFNEMVNLAYCLHLDNHPNSKPTMDTGHEEDYQLARLVWLKYWTNWAGENCEHPIFHNT